MNENIRQLDDKALAWYALSTAGQRARGAAWYPSAAQFCRLLARENGITLAQSAGVVAVLSPACYWDLNKKQAEDLCNAHAAGQPLEDVVLATYGVQAHKARMILRLDPEDHSVETVRAILGHSAHKTRAFFSNLIDPQSQAVTIDRHILAALGITGKVHVERARVYNLYSQAIVRAADRIDLAPRTLQAIVWVTFKENTEAYSVTESRPEDEAPF